MGVQIEDERKRDDTPHNDVRQLLRDDGRHLSRPPGPNGRRTNWRHVELDGCQRKELIKENKQKARKSKELSTNQRSPHLKILPEGSSPQV